MKEILKQLKTNSENQYASTTDLHITNVRMNNLEKKVDNLQEILKNMEEESNAKTSTILDKIANLTSYVTETTTEVKNDDTAWGWGEYNPNCYNSSCSCCNGESNHQCEEDTDEDFEIEDEEDEEIEIKFVQEYPGIVIGAYYDEYEEPYLKDEDYDEIADIISGKDRVDIVIMTYDAFNLVSATALTKLIHKVVTFHVVRSLEQADMLIRALQNELYK